MSHQTIGGFMMTSTTGGSFEHGFSDVVESMYKVAAKIVWSSDFVFVFPVYFINFGTGPVISPSLPH